MICCALPSLLVLLGFGTTVAAVVSAAPWLVVLSQNKIWVFLAAGPKIRTGRLPDLTLYDVAPTVLHLMGVAVPRELPGKVILEMLRLESRAPPPLLANSPTPTKRLGVQKAKTATVPFREQELERLRSLGYVQ